MASNASCFLQQVRLIDTHIENKLQELGNLKDFVLKITPALKQDAVSGGGTQDKLGDAIAKIVDLENEIDRAIDEYVDKKREISGVLEFVTDPDQLKVLHKRYFEYKQWEQIACEMFMSYRNVCYIHGNALLTVERILKGKTEVAK